MTQKVACPCTHVEPRTSIKALQWLLTAVPHHTTLYKELPFSGDQGNEKCFITHLLFNLLSDTTISIRYPSLYH